jgi:hypothetical protein
VRVGCWWWRWGEGVVVVEHGWRCGFGSGVVEGVVAGCPVAGDGAGVLGGQADQRIDHAGFLGAERIQAWADTAYELVGLGHGHDAAADGPVEVGQFP